MRPAVSYGEALANIRINRTGSLSSWAHQKYQEMQAICTPTLIHGLTRTHGKKDPLVEIERDNGRLGFSLSQFAPAPGSQQPATASPKGKRAYEACEACEAWESVQQQSTVPTLFTNDPLLPTFFPSLSGRLKSWCKSLLPGTPSSDCTGQGAVAGPDAAKKGSTRR